MTFDINVTIWDTRCTAALESRIPLTTGCRGEFRVVLRQDESWADMDKTVVFRAGRVERSQHIGTGTECLVPPEVLASTASALEIGVYGTIGGDVVRTTTFARVCGVFQGAWPTDDPTQTPDLYAQLLAELAATVRTVNGQEPDENGNVNVEGGGGAGTPGGYYTPSVTQPDDNTMRVSYTASQDGMADVPDVDLTLPQGPKGETGAPGSAGKDGQDGAPGADGSDGITPTIGENGNWYLGDTDTGKPSRGETGPAGDEGAPGSDGKTAFEYAQDGGYTGTEEEFAAKLAAEMPDKLPNPYALTFTGAVEGSYDGSKALTVEIPSGGGGLGDLKLIVDHTIEENVSEITYTADEYPDIANLKLILIHIKLGTATTTGWWKLNCGNTSVISGTGVSSAVHYYGHAEVKAGNWLCNAGGSSNNAASQQLWAPVSTFSPSGGYVSIPYSDFSTLKLYGNNFNLPAGTVIKIWGAK